MRAEVFCSPRHARFLAFILIGSLFLTLVKLGLLIPVYTGLLAFGLVTRFSKRVGDERIRSVGSK